MLTKAWNYCVPSTPFEKKSAAVVLQRPVRAWLARRELFALRLARWRMRRAVSIRVWGDKVVNPVWAAVERHADSKKQENERLSMEVADIESRASRQYMKLQIVLQAMETQKMAVGALVAMTGVLDPHPTVRGKYVPKIHAYRVLPPANSALEIITFLCGHIGSGLRAVA